MKTLRRHRKLVGIVNLVAICTYSTLGYADTLYKNNGDATLLEQPTTAGFNTITNYAEGSGLTAGDILSYTNLINAAVTNRLTTTVGGTISLGGIRIGEMFNGAVLNPGGAVTIRNLASGGTQTLNVGASGIDMSLAGQNLTFQRDTGGSANMSVVINAPQTWAMRTGRTRLPASSPGATVNRLSPTLTPVTARKVPVSEASGRTGYGLCTST